MLYFNKRAISPLIATILLIVVTVAIIAIVVSWGKGFTNTSLSSVSTVPLYTESETGFYLNVKSSINGRTTFSYNPPQNTPYESLTIVGYGLLGYTTDIVPLEPEVTVLKNQTINIDHGIILPTFDLVLYLDNNTMVTKFNLKQEIKQPASCPDGFIPVPGNHLYETMNERGGFCVMKWEAKTDANSEVQEGCRWNSLYYHFRHNKETLGLFDCNVFNYNIVSTSLNHPITQISQVDSVLACESMGTHLITNDEWMTIARNVELVSTNWSDGVIGEGYLPIGNSNNLYTEIGYSLDGVNPLTGIEKRTLTLSNGNVIWDLAGNVWEWTANVVDMNLVKPSIFDVNDNEVNLSLWSNYSYDDNQTEGIYTYLKWNNLNSEFFKYKDLFLLSNKYNYTNGVGRIYITSNSNVAFLRSGNWNRGNYAGILGIHLGLLSDSSGDTRGFRCVK